MSNTLFPIFLKIDKFQVLIVGGGNIGLEKITAVLNNSPDTELILVGETILPEIKEFAANFPNTRLIERVFEYGDLENKHFAIVATENKALNSEIQKAAKAKGILVNVADTPAECDFYLGSIVQKGDLKIAISTNGKSPTVAKRLKEFLNEIIPDEIDMLLGNMTQVRQLLKGDFAEKVRVLNVMTQVLTRINRGEVK